jgi:nitroreductase
MKLLKVMEKKRSVREYKHKDVEKETLGKVEMLLDQVPEISDKTEAELVLFYEGEEIYRKLDGIAGYNGLMIKAPHYAVVLTTDTEEAPLIGGYAGEWFSLNLSTLELGSCWIDMNFNEEKVKAALELDTKQRAIGLIAFGYASYKPRRGKVTETKPEGGSLTTITEIGYPNIDIEYAKEPISGRKGIEEIVFLKEFGQKITRDELEKRGLQEVFYYMRLAPSWGNRQPWHFLIDGMEIQLIMERDDRLGEEMAQIEAGIAMLYFEVSMHDQGLPGHWVLEEAAQETSGIPSDYFIAGRYRF